MSGVHRFHNILFSPLAANGSSSAIRRVEALADRDDADLAVVGVIPAPSRLERLIHGAEHIDAAIDEARHRIERDLTRCERAVDREVTTIIDVGGPALALVRRAVVAGHDLIAVSSDRSDDERALIRRLLRKSPCPVLVLRPTRAKQLRVLAAIDPEPDEQAFNELILDIAASLSSAGGGELHVVNAWQLYGESTMTSSAFVHVDPTELARQRDWVRRSHDEAVNRLVRARLGDAPQIHVEQGAPNDVIVDLVDRERINLVVMGSVGRAGVSGIVMGNTAERLADDLACSFAVVKPPGFVSPILA